MEWYTLVINFIVVLVVFGLITWLRTDDDYNDYDD